MKTYGTNSTSLGSVELSNTSPKKPRLADARIENNVIVRTLTLEDLKGDLSKKRITLHPNPSTGIPEWVEVESVKVTPGSVQEVARESLRKIIGAASAVAKAVISAFQGLSFR